jgi:hypothetical protein
MLVIFLSLWFGMSGGFGFADILNEQIQMSEIDLLGTQLLFSVLGSLLCHNLFKNIFTTRK